MDLAQILGAVFLIHLPLWPVSFLYTQRTFDGQRQWYLISLVACLAFGMFGFLGVWMAYRWNQRRDVPVVIQRKGTFARRCRENETEESSE